VNLSLINDTGLDQVAKLIVSALKAEFSSSDSRTRPQSAPFVPGGSVGSLANGFFRAHAFTMFTPRLQRPVSLSCLGPARRQKGVPPPGHAFPQRARVACNGVLDASRFLL